MEENAGEAINSSRCFRFFRCREFSPSAGLGVGGGVGFFTSALAFWGAGFAGVGFAFASTFGDCGAAIGELFWGCGVTCTGCEGVAGWDDFLRRTTRGLLAVVVAMGFPLVMMETANVTISREKGSLTPYPPDRVKECPLSASC